MGRTRFSPNRVQRAKQGEEAWPLASQVCGPHQLPPGLTRWQVLRPRTLTCPLGDTWCWEISTPPGAPRTHVGPPQARLEPPELPLAGRPAGVALTQGWQVPLQPDCAGVGVGKVGAPGGGARAPLGACVGVSRRLKRGVGCTSTFLGSEHRGRLGPGPSPGSAALLGLSFPSCHPQHGAGWGPPEQVWDRGRLSVGECQRVASAFGRPSEPSRGQAGGRGLGGASCHAA